MHCMIISMLRIMNKHANEPRQLQSSRQAQCGWFAWSPLEQRSLACCHSCRLVGRNADGLFGHVWTNQADWDQLNGENLECNLLWNVMSLPGWDSLCDWWIVVIASSDCKVYNLTPKRAQYSCSSDQNKGDVGSTQCDYTDTRSTIHMLA